MQLHRQKWSAKLEKEGKADDTLIIINKKPYTPREIIKKSYYGYKS